jgi:hypothetical protein
LRSKLLRSTLVRRKLRAGLPAAAAAAAVTG